MGGAERALGLPADLLDAQERAVLTLRQLYRAAGYRRARMGKFEPYDLYARHKDFLVSDAVITFTGRGGRLLALRPDVTLSLVKGCRGGQTARLQYGETVYRPGLDGEYREITQAGLECLGQIGEAESLEVAALAAASLRALGADGVLTLSHSGLVAQALDSLAGEAAPRERLLELLRLKALGGLEGLRQSGGVSEEGAALLRLMIESPGRPEETLDRLGRWIPESAALSELRQVCAGLAAKGQGVMTRLDFSLWFDPSYYAGLLFKGYLPPLPEALLVGGRYDPLTRRMGKPFGGIGFAVYLDQLDRLSREDEA